jgi:hypothetical protein
MRPNRSIKEVLGYPLTPRFRELLAKVEETSPERSEGMKPAKEQIEVNLEELVALVGRARKGR